MMKQAIICGAFLTEKYRSDGEIRKPGKRKTFITSMTMTAKGW